MFHPDFQQDSNCINGKYGQKNQFIFKFADSENSCNTDKKGKDCGQNLIPMPMVEDPKPINEYGSG